VSAEEHAWVEAVLSHEGPLSPEQAALVLRLGFDTSEQAAKSAYRKLSVRWHPDKHSGEEAQARATAVFVRLSAAYHTLTTANFDFERCAAPAGRSQQAPCTRRDADCCV